MVNVYLWHLQDIGIIDLSTGLGLTLSCGLLRCILLMSIAPACSTAPKVSVQVAAPTLAATPALTLFRCVVYLRNKKNTKTIM